MRADQADFPGLQTPDIHWDRPWKAAGNDHCAHRPHQLERLMQRAALSSDGLYRDIRLTAQLLHQTLRGMFLAGEDHRSGAKPAC
jgi:hypothetical protein